MRDIKFRAWDIENKRWVSNTSWLNKTEVSASVLAPSKLTIKHPNWDIMQYTGLKDKHGTEIYEGDIIKFSIRDSRYKTKGEVVWWQGEAAFLIKCDNEIYKHFDEVSELEVIDNIYENLEYQT